MARQPRKGAARSPASRASRRADRARCPPGDRWEADGLDRERRSQEKLTGCHPGTPSARVPRRARLGTRPVRGIRAHLIPEPRQFSFCSMLTGCLVLESSLLATRYSQLSGLHGGTGFAMRSRSARRFRAGHRAHTVGGWARPPLTLGPAGSATDERLPMTAVYAGSPEEIARVVLAFDRRQRQGVSAPVLPRSRIGSNTHRSDALCSLT